MAETTQGAVVYGACYASGVPYTYAETVRGQPVMHVMPKSGDAFHGGRGSIPGTVKRASDPADLPLRRRVRLHREQDGMAIRETWSDAATGEYLFTDINPALKYTVISYDHAHEYRAEAADNIAPDVMP